MPGGEPGAGRNLRPDLRRGNSQVADYALYFINSKLGYFERELPLDAVNDQVAIGIARRHCGCQALELWCGGRLVERFPEQPPLAPPSQVAA